MIIAVSGPRSFAETDWGYPVVKACIENALLLIGRPASEIEVLYSGHARGVDRYAEAWAGMNDIRVHQFLPDWNKLGRAAGMIRNEEMAFYSHYTIIIWDGVSRGTKGMLDYCVRTGRKHFLYMVQRPQKILNWHHMESRITPPGAIDISRSSRWGNPFIVGTHGTRADVIRKHREWIVNRAVLMRALPTLIGHDLICYCAPLPCHGDTLLELAGTNKVAIIGPQGQRICPPE